MKALFVTNKSLVDSLRSGLAEGGVHLEVAEQSGSADFQVRAGQYDAVLLDHDRLDGDNCSRLLGWRRAGLQAHVLVLLPGDCDSSDRASFLDAGADVCLLQPLCARELQAHLRALRRRDEQTVRPILHIHDLEINTATRRVRRGGNDLHLTPRELDLLLLLARHQGRVVSRSMIREQLWDWQEEHSNVVDVYIRYLRNKIDRNFSMPLILTHRGQGYLLRARDA